MSKIFEAFVEYDFDNDTRFQSGIGAILGKSSQQDDPAVVMERAKWFYYTKFIESFDFAEYLEWKKTKQEKNEIQESADNAPPKLTFAEISDLINSGQEIPGIRDIPNKLNEGIPSEPKLDARPKPWMTKR